MNLIDRDPQLWRQAKVRAKFKSHLGTYLLVNLLLWGIWLATGARMGGGLPWPVFPMLFWGLGLVIQALATYGCINAHSLSEREYQRLLRDKQAKR